MSQVSCEEEKTLALVQRFHAASFLLALSHSLAVCVGNGKHFGFFHLTFFVFISVKEWNMTGKNELQEAS